jgi:hypothetical protein
MTASDITALISHPNNILTDIQKWELVLCWVTAHHLGAGVEDAPDEFLKDVVRGFGENAEKELELLRRDVEGFLMCGAIDVFKIPEQEGSALLF